MAVTNINGLPIIDAKRPLVVHVTAEDIAHADRKEPDDCAMARAVRRDCHAKEVRVHLGRVYVRSNQGNWVRYMTPPSLRAEIVAFDRGGSFEPGEFVLGAPQPSRRTTQQQGSTTSQRPKKLQRPRRPPHIMTNVRPSVTRNPRDG